jgi:hypothetical protein
MDLMNLFIASAAILVGIFAGIALGFALAYLISKLLGWDFKKAQLFYTICMCLCAVIITTFVKNMLLSYGIPKETITYSFIIAGIVGFPLVMIVSRMKK